MYGPHPNRQYLNRNLIGAVRKVACRLGCCAVVSLFAGIVADQALAAELSAGELPRFVDAQSLDSLRHALLIPTPDTSTPTADAIMPRFHGAAAVAASGVMDLVNSGDLDQHAPRAALVAPIATPGDGALGVPSRGDITTSHFQQTLTGARREAGEARELADEVRRRAEELTQRLASDSQGRAVPIPRDAGDVHAVTPMVAASPAAVPAKGSTANAVKHYSEDDVAPVAGLQVAPSEASTGAQPGAARPGATAAMGAMVSPAPMAGNSARSNPAADAGSDAGSAVKRTVAHSAPAKRKTGVAVASSSAGPVRKLVKATATGSHVPLAAKPGAAERMAKSDANPSQDDAAGKADAQPGPEPKPAGGLLSWLKPFTFPKEIGGLGWASTD